MQSITRPVLDKAQVIDAVQKHLGAPPAKVEEILDGWFSAIFRIEMPDGAGFMLKVAPPNEVKLLRYEAHAMATEVQSMRMIREKSNVPIPAIVAYDTSQEIIPCDFFLMKTLPGVGLNKLRDQLEQPAQDRIDHQVGKHLRELHSITGTGFGLFGGPLYSSMPEAYFEMVSELERDAADFAVEGVAEALALAKRNAGYLADAKTPSLVHWDLNDGNVIVDPDTCGVTGYIDFERALWADPLFEFNFLWPHAAFLKGYAAEAFPRAASRRNLYELYLALVWVIECYSRGFTADHEAWGREMLAKAVGYFG